MIRFHGASMVHTLIVTAGLITWAHAAQPDACKATTNAALRSSRAGMQRDKWLATGRCENSPDGATQKACDQQTAADARDAQAAYRSQREARQAVCTRLGPGPYSPTIDAARFVTSIDNPLFPLTPGQTLIYEGQTPEGLEHSEFAVTHGTRIILGVTCIEVHDTVTVGGMLREDTLDWFAQDREGNVWYFGENSKQIDGGLIVGLAGSWTAGVDGAQPGIVMEAHPAVGDFYRQEFLLGQAEDMAEIVSLAQPVTVPAGSFPTCLEAAETSPLEPDALEHKYYAAGVGTVLTVDPATGERSELVGIRTE
ncbi:MAG: hypothetical protein U0807_09405 [Candidatus Binatia bacterium]